MKIEYKTNKKKNFFLQNNSEDNKNRQILYNFDNHKEYNNQ